MISEKSLNCDDCVIRADQRGHLWFINKQSTGVAKINTYNPYFKTIEVKIASKDTHDIKHVAFKKGKVYGLGKSVT